jgi:hypothetical protein
MKMYFKNIWDAICGKTHSTQIADPIIDLDLILERAEEEESLKPDGFDGNPDGYDRAIVGITRDGQLVYSIEKMIEICAEDGQMDDLDAIEWLEYNTFCAYVGEKTPQYIHTSTGY